MRIDFSEPECSNCFHCRSLGILNTQESEPVSSMPVSSGPVQALEHDSAAVGSTSASSPAQALSHDSADVGSTLTSSTAQALSHDSAAVGSTSTSSPVQALGDDDSAATGSISTFRLGSKTPPASPLFNSLFRLGSQNPFSPPVITSVSSEPLQTLGITSLRSDASAGAPPVQATSGSGASATSTSSTSSPFQSVLPDRFLFAPAITSVSSAPTQACGPNTSGFNAFAAPTQPSFGSMQAPVQATSGFNAFPASTQPSFWSMQAPVQATSGFNAFPASTQPSFGSMQAPVQATSGFNLFAAPTQPSFFWSMQAPFQATSGFNAFPAPAQPSLGSTQAPVQATTGFGAFSNTAPPRFGLGSTQAPVEATFGSGASGISTSSGFLPCGCVPPPPTNGSTVFGPPKNLPWTSNTLSTGGRLDWVRPDVCILPATSSPSLFRPNPSTPTEVFGATPGNVSLPAQDYPTTGVNRFALPFNRVGQNISTTGSNSGFPGFGVDYLPGGGSIFGGSKTSSPQPFGFNAATTTPLPSSSLSSPATFSTNPNTGLWSCHNEQCIWYPPYAPTPDEVTGGMCISISASPSHQHKSHEELRWEDYKRGNKGCRKQAVFAYPQMASKPPMFASPSVPDHPQRTYFDTTQESYTGPGFCFPQHNPAFTGFGTQFPQNSSPSLFTTTTPPISSSVERPHEATTAVSSPASKCTACGATTSTSSASGYSTFYGATLAPSPAATTFLPGQLYPPTYGYGLMIFGITPAAQVITPAALQAYPFIGYIILPFAAMSLH